MKVLIRLKRKGEAESERNRMDPRGSLLLLDIDMLQQQLIN